MAEAQVQRTAQDQGRHKGQRPILSEGARQPEALLRTLYALDSV
jgi:hypothetical protein